MLKTECIKYSETVYAKKADSRRRRASFGVRATSAEFPWMVTAQFIIKSKYFLNHYVQTLSQRLQLVADTMALNIHLSTAAAQLFPNTS